MSNIALLSLPTEALIRHIRHAEEETQYLKNQLVKLLNASLPSITIRNGILEYKYSSETEAMIEFYNNEIRKVYAKHGFGES